MFTWCVMGMDQPVVTKRFKHEVDLFYWNSKGNETVPTFNSI